jgi:hypothetical protein
MRVSTIGQSTSLSAGSWPKGRSNGVPLVEGLLTIARWLGSLLLIPLLVVLLAALVLDQRYRFGRSWGSILGWED